MQTPFGATRNEPRHRKFIGRTVSKIVLPVFEIIEKEARRRNLYTYEIAYGSKASKIFQFEDFDFEKEDILQTELLVYFMSKAAIGCNARFIRDMSPLSFDPALEADYLAALRTNLKKLHVLDELEELYQDEVIDFKDRTARLEAASSEHLSYGMDDEDEADAEE
ncbi:hypothetical protein KTN05_14850 [Paracoccus sp. Z118]|uniref:hypothetical protein n=1 Tax=Paracoccus sp. Z118 TaxID=2851017 RepID=UPI001C2C45FD|nr:hypothetical protein [Paracoccus sp. Z118]MBV0893098.1 hypothetical protein [Paracoccus sp. Z118]